MVAEVYTSTVRKRYYASRFSLTYFYYIGVGVLTIILPFFLSYYASGGSFWLKESTYSEQATIKSKAKLMLLLEGDSGGTPTNIFFSTMGSINELMSNNLRVPQIKSREVDENRDGKVDRIELSISMPLFENEKIYSASLVNFLHFQLKEKTMIDMESLVYAQESSGIQGSSWYIDGTINFEQTSPLQKISGMKYLYTGAEEILLDSITDSTSLISSQDIDLSSLLLKYNSRNFSTTLAPSTSVWTRGYNGNRLDQQLSTNVFNTTIILRIPVARIKYTPDVAEVLKDAWIQYAAFLLVVAFLLDRLSSFVYTNKLLNSRVRTDGYAAQLGAIGSSKYY